LVLGGLFGAVAGGAGYGAGKLVTEKAAKYGETPTRAWLYGDLSGSGISEIQSKLLLKTWRGMRIGSEVQNIDGQKTSHESN